MSNVDTIFVCVHHGEKSEKAFNWYLDNLHKPQNKVVVYHCVEFEKAPLGGNVFRKPTMEEYLLYETELLKSQKKTNELVEKYENILKNLKITGKVVVSSSKAVGEEILKKAASENAILLVTGTREQGTKKSFLSSVSNYLLHHSRIPIAICNRM